MCTEHGARVLVCGCEYARDLTAIPAALQGDTIVVRQEALRQWLWEKAEAWGMKRQRGRDAGRRWPPTAISTTPAAALERMTEGETETLILHEQGEFLAGRQLGPEWEAMLSGLKRRRAELLLRAVRDNWADCLEHPAAPARARGGRLAAFLVLQLRRHAPRTVSRCW